jgi:5'-nucleotidase
MVQKRWPLHTRSFMIQLSGVESGMRVLVSNDDGVDAPGIKILAEYIRKAGHQVVTVAPDRNRSGASNSLTLDQPIRVKQIDEHTFSVSGTPTDCVHLSLSGMLPFDPDIVVS